MGSFPNDERCGCLWAEKRKRELRRCLVPEEVVRFLFDDMLAVDPSERPAAREAACRMKKFLHVLTPKSQSQ